MSLEAIVTQLGYPALVVGLLLEGETFNVVGALIWAVTFGIAGYAFGQVMEIALEDVSQYERELAVAIFVAGTGILLYHRWRSKRRRD